MKKARLMTLKEDYELIGINKDVSLKEDGIRTSGKMGEYEWWYFDNKFKDGSSLVVVFFTGPITSVGNGFKPHVTFDYVSKDKEIHTSYYAKDGNYSFSQEMCNVKIGECYVKGDLNEYEIYYKDETVESKIFLKGKVPAWRPYTGRITFDEKKYFAWLPSIPEGEALVSIKHNNFEFNSNGNGYHDHNWGNAPMFFLMHHWYWGRAKIGNYTCITSYITAQKKYQNVETPIFMIAKDGKILADDALNYLKYSESDYEYNQITKHKIAKKLIYDYVDKENRYLITYNAQETVEQKGMKELTNSLQYILCKLLKLEGSYQRVTGPVTLEVYKNENLIEKIESHAMWEQMYFKKD